MHLKLLGQDQRDGQDFIGTEMTAPDGIQSILFILSKIRL